MQLILAIDSDPRRSEQLANLVRARLSVDLVQATSAGEGLHALKDRIPDLILTSPLLSPFDDGVLDEYLRDLGSAATHVQTVRIPMLSSGPKKKSAAGRLFSLGRKKTQTSAAAPDGCDPKVFADEITHYLTRSLEERSASATATADKSSSAKVGSPGNPITTALATADVMTQPVADEWGEPDALVQEFREAAVAASAPIAAPEAVTAAIEETHVPGSILDLRPPLVHPAERQARVEPEPVALRPEPMFIEPEPVFVQPEPVFLRPEPVFIEPEPLFVEPDPVEMHPAVKAFLEPEPFDSAQGRPVRVEPQRPVIAQPEIPAIAKNDLVSTPAAFTAPKLNAAAQPVPATATSASFEAALAAIRAAWAKPGQAASKPEEAASKPEQAASRPQPMTTAHATGAKPLGASGEVDLTNEIDALEDIGGVGGNAPAAGDVDSPDGSSTTNPRRKIEHAKKRPEKPRARKTRGPDGRDDWGVLDPKKYEFSALVNKLDEVTDSDEVTTRATNSR